ncbi:DegT/DnrJ/EryC1/StrS family aminotransferase [Polynucleobacter sp. AP-Sanab-80-C2]|uniref:DegT/DnrJ/EryC1/StrS family aminotransferase n=1 Tax=Polynucleobacter sp. AP-Sanab-80-C2 TaxID=3108274 RepID=UPI002B238D86|nr:DegT/DnrJ/EryC1/StrS family aminotransferase [Polynucleobacter sp. AP-Sanab-80-C2]MEA9598564.1 DegT/DnrJ/EryC1/StrS family aminotransferase [Polynucleobacter sp. AP-Sanab-80-C2]
MSIASSEKLQNYLCSSLNKKYCLLTSRATSGIYIALKTLNINKGKVICPTLMCPHPANAIFYAGFEPLFCDSNLFDFNIDIDELNTLLQKTPDIVAIVAPHLYGQPCQIEVIKKMAIQHDILLIEDLAQAYGASLNDVPLGYYGDFSVVSFGHSKIIDIGIGGALLTNDYDLYKQSKAIEKNLPQKPLNYKEITANYRREYYEIQNANSSRQYQISRKKALVEKYREMYIFRLDVDFSVEVLNLLLSLSDCLKIRKSNYAQFRDKLECLDIYIPPLNRGSAPWRFNFLTGKQKSITEKLRFMGLDASNWYPTTHDLFVESELNLTFKNAIRIENEIINLWINPGTSQSYIDNCCLEIKQFFNRSQI